MILYDDQSKPYNPTINQLSEWRGGSKSKLENVDGNDFEAVRQGLHLVSAGYQAYKKFFDMQALCRDFRRDRQWFDEDLAHFERMKRLPLTVNILKSKIRRVSGLQRQNRSDIPITPVDTGGDKVVAEWGYKVMRHLQYVNRLERVTSRVMQDGLEAMGVYHLWLEPGEQIDPQTFKPTLEVKIAAAPRYSTLFDYTWHGPIMDDCGWVIHIRYMTAQEIVRRFPGKAEGIPWDYNSFRNWELDLEGVMMGMPRFGSPSFAVREENKFAVLQLERRVVKPVLYAIDVNTGEKIAPFKFPREAVPLFEMVTGYKVAEYDSAQIQQRFLLPYYYKLLEDNILPYSSYSFIPFVSERFNEPIPDCTSYLNSLIGLQREKNVARSNNLEATTRALRGGNFISDNDTGGGKAVYEEMEREGHRIGKNYLLKPGVTVTPVHDPKILESAAWRENKADIDMEEVSAVSQLASFGGSKTGESGYKRELMQVEGLTALYQYFDDLNEIEAMVAGAMLDRFAAHSSAPYALAVIGNNPSEAPELVTMTPEIMAQMRRIQHFDVRIKEGPFAITKRRIEHEERVVLAEVIRTTDPNAARGVLPMVIRGSDLPDAEEIAQDIEASQEAEMLTAPPEQITGGQQSAKMV